MVINPRHVGMMLTKVYLNDSLVNVDEASIPSGDLGFLTGSGIFETLIARSGEAFAVSRHYRRLAASAAVFEIEPPSESHFREAIESVLQANPMEQARVRATLTSGVGLMGQASDKTQRCFIVTAAPVQLVTEQVRGILVPFTRNEKGALVGVKSQSYGENVVALAWARARKAGEALFLNTEGLLCEGATSNVFVHFKGEWRTPSLDSGCLPGVTRELVLELAVQAGISIHEEAIPGTCLDKIDAAFLTSSIRGVLPFSKIGNRELDLRNGEMRRLSTAYKAILSKSKNP